MTDRDVIKALLPLAREESRRQHNQDRDQELDRNGDLLAPQQRHRGIWQACRNQQCALVRRLTANLNQPEPTP